MMNERIKELANESGLIKYYSDGKMEEAINFAKLIVQECARVGYDASYYECALHVADNIKEHFGVK